MKAGSLREHLRVGIYKQLAHIRENLIRAGYTVRQDGDLFSILRGERVIAEGMLFGELLVLARRLGP